MKWLFQRFFKASWRTYAGIRRWVFGGKSGVPVTKFAVIGDQKGDFEKC
jgi:hypothetical protein